MQRSKLQQVRTYVVLYWHYICSTRIVAILSSLIAGARFPPHIERLWPVNTAAVLAVVLEHPLRLNIALYASSYLDLSACDNTVLE